MKVYEGFKGLQIKFKPTIWNSETEFMVFENEKEIRLIKINKEMKGGIK